MTVDKVGVIMPRTFKVEKYHTGIVSKTTLFKVLKYLERKNIETPFLLVDKEKVMEKVSLIGRNIKTPRSFMLLRLILISR